MGAVTVISSLIRDQNAPLKYHTHVFYVYFLLVSAEGYIKIKVEMYGKHSPFCNIAEKRLVSDSEVVSCFLVITIMKSPDFRAYRNLA